MANGMLYSTNVALKLFIQERYAGDKHYIWCSEHFDSAALPRYAGSSLVAPSSNPADIFREIKRDVSAGDFHSAKLAAQKASFIARAHEWERAGKISVADREDILFIVEKATLKEWRPLIYVVRRDAVSSRLQPVPASKRASLGDEFIVPDAARDEFDILEI